MWGLLERELVLGMIVAVFTENFTSMEIEIRREPSQVHCISVDHNGGERPESFQILRDKTPKKKSRTGKNARGASGWSPDIPSYYLSSSNFHKLPC